MEALYTVYLKLVVSEASTYYLVVRHASFTMHLITNSRSVNPQRLGPSLLSHDNRSQERSHARLNRQMVSYG